MAATGLHVLSFDDDLRARELLLALLGLQRGGHLELEDAVLVHRDPDGRRVTVQQTTDVSNGAGAAEGGFWGLVLGTILLGPVGALAGGAIGAASGALTAKLVDVGIPDEVVDEVERAVPAGATALVVLVARGDQAAWDAELARFPTARPLHVPIHADAERKLRTAGFEPSQQVEVLPAAPGA